MMGIRNTITALVSSFALVAGASSVALAQDAEPMAPEVPEVTAPVADFDQTQIEAFAVAYVQIMDIAMAADQQIQAAETDEERASLQIEAQGQMEGVVEGTDGITIDDYNGILTAAQADPAFAEEVQGAVDTVVGQAN